MNETWEDRYKRAVADFVGVPKDVPASDITIDVYGENGYSYSEYTFADPDLNIKVSWPEGDKFLDTPEEIAGLLKSFLTT